ncbi:uncharacterized protein G2W53_014203 [Senna tora]|uniref:Uncharacterized protein n=1 Tax=Senna tora TaxID=362788 RepID=A0A835C5C7_9FABA|nr:uncharacterized protein G2W53_014203 [Senna tora]
MTTRIVTSAHTEIWNKFIDTIAKQQLSSQMYTSLKVLQTIYKLATKLSKSKFDQDSRMNKPCQYDYTGGKLVLLHSTEMKKPFPMEPQLSRTHENQTYNGKKSGFENHVSSTTSTRVPSFPVYVTAAIEEVKTMRFTDDDFAHD